MMELSWVEINRRREQGPIGKKKKECEQPRDCKTKVNGPAHALSMDRTICHVWH